MCSYPKLHQKLARKSLLHSSPIGAPVPASSRSVAVLTFAIATFFVCSTSQADLDEGGVIFNARADQTVRVTDDSPLEPLRGQEFQLSAFGFVDLSWAADSDGDGSALVTNFSAAFAESHPVLGEYILISGGPASVDFSGSLDNIVESGGQLISADWTINTTFSILFPATGAELYTRDNTAFTGQIRNGLSGEVFSSPELVDAFLNTGNGTGDPLAATSSNRTVTAVPEPSTIIMLSSIYSACCLVRRRSPK